MTYKKREKMGIREGRGVKEGRADWGKGQSEYTLSWDGQKEEISRKLELKILWK